MKHALYFLIILAFLPITNSAQTYQWQWAKAGGGDNANTSTGFTIAGDETIRDVVVDDQNNSYYLTTINPGNPNLNGIPVTNYNLSDLFLFSTDCNGNIRWSRTIGGKGENENAWKIEVDNMGGVYLMANTINATYSSQPATFPPIRFGDNDALPPIAIQPLDPGVDPGLKTGFLLRYNTSDGSLSWRKDLQGDVTNPLRYCDNGVWYMDQSTHTIHALIGYFAGSHLNGLINVPSNFTSTAQYYLVKFQIDTNNPVNSPTIVGTPLLLPITGFITVGLYEGMVNMVYDATLNRYYIAGKRKSFYGSSYIDLSYNGTPFTQDGYIFAFDGSTTNELWRKEFNFANPTPFGPDHRIFDIIKDASSNIFISGYYLRFSAQENTTTFGTTSLPDNITVRNPFVMKLNSNGVVQWTKTPSALTNGSTSLSRSGEKTPIALNGNEIAFAKGANIEIWDSFTMNRPLNDDTDPLLLRLNKDTGAVIAGHDIKSNFGQQDELTAVAVDNDGNYIVGGFFQNELFVDPNDNVPTITYNTGSSKSQFFAAKLAKSACSPLATEEISVKETDMQFYPNPVEDVLTIKTKESLKTYEVISAVGQQVKRGAFKGNNYTINMQGLTKGVYFVKVFTDKISVVEKVVKK